MVLVEETQSNSAPDTSGIPQDTAVGPLLFLTCTNDLPMKVHFKSRQLADDCAIHRLIRSNDVISVLQDDLKRLEEGEND